jgi:hypothetical protein
VPSVIDLAANEDDRQVVRLLAAPNEGAQPFLAPPTIPQDRAEILRTAIDATLNDPALKADAQKSGLALDSMNGSELESFIKRVYETPTAVVARAADISRILVSRPAEQFRQPRDVDGHPRGTTWRFRSRGSETSAAPVY